MDAHTVIEEWEVSPFDGGFEGIDSLRSRGFSGAVEADGTWLFFEDGDPLAVRADIDEAPREGDIDAFEDASGRTHEAPHPATAALAAMLTLDGDVRGQYFSDETPLSTVHETLSEGGFTGYVELSKNVLSGDYFVVYEDGEASYLGYLGPSGRLLTGEEAQSKAEGEVGIYDVVAVRLPAVELPEPAPEPNETAVVGADGDETADPDEELEAEDTEAEAVEASDEHEAETTVGGEPTDDEPEDTEVVGDYVDATDGQSADEDDSEPETAEIAETTDTDADGADEEPTHAVPSVDPENSGDGAGEATPHIVESGTESAVDAETRAEFDSEVASERETSVESGSEAGRHERAAGTDTDEAETESDKTEAETDDEVETESEPSSNEAELEALREEFESELSSLRSKVDALQAERDRLQQRIAEQETEDTDGRDGGAVSLSSMEAFEGTNLFIREDSRGGATLENAHDGSVDPEALAENLRIEYHTRFESEGATVGGTPFDSFLRSSVPYAFVEWLVTDLLFEIQSTGTEGAMRHLYDALPEIDRIGFDETIRVGDGQEGREVDFDIVARDRMGDPLVVANIDESRDPTSGESMGPLVTDASDVCEEHETLAAAFAVTSSFFEPDALSTAREATSGSLLSREKYRSYVKLARKNGFHLCLVESREESFHLTVPEL
ncbi:hypothetical protein [Natronomonas gomsonensis]|uniref:DUF7527 domain-containing protein n=1 Tax=Natronomonas gomsonensis TaxID=1046043 RepID=UPI0015BA1CEE|nr:hypothetical protein [Natronomonas gomsonensis]